MTISETLSDYAIRLTYGDLTEEVIHQTKRLLLDTLGVGLGGFLSEPSRIVRSLVWESGGKAEATVLGSGERTLCSNAAFANGVMMRYLDFCDVYHGSTPCHPSENIPTALGVGERQHSAGKDVIVAIVLGYELQCRLADAVPLNRLGWLHVTLGGYVVPWVAGKLLGLRREEMVNAVGISGSTNHALRTPGETTMMKAAGYPLAAQKGIQAALMAQKGFRGPRTVIEMFNRTVGQGSDLTSVTQGGQSFRILQTSMKCYAAAGKIQPALTVLFRMMEEHAVRPEDVQAVTVRTYAYAAANAARPNAYRPENRESADQSLPYCIAMALREGELGPKQFLEGKRKDPKVLDLMKRVNVVADPGLEKLYPGSQPAELEIRIQGGQTFTGRVDHPKGAPSHPLTDEDVERKFRMLVSPLMAEDRIEQITAMVGQLQEVEDIGELMELLVV